jgi:hypothetical protein
MEIEQSALFVMAVRMMEKDGVRIVYSIWNLKIPV